MCHQPLGFAYTARVSVLAGLVPVFLLLALGVAARQWGLLDRSAAVGLNRLVATIALPVGEAVNVEKAQIRQARRAPGQCALLRSRGQPVGLSRASRLASPQTK